VSFLSFFRFYTARWFANDLVCLVTLMLSITLSIIVLIAILVSHRQLQTLTQDGAVLNHRSMSMKARLPFSANTKLKLPEFIPGDLVKIFNSVANDMQVPLEEVVYVLDRSVSVPYLRYHVTLSTKAGYTDIRKFIAVLSSEMPNVSLDRIRCSRPDALAQTLDCELAFSAVFAKEASRG